MLGSATKNLDGASQARSKCQSVVDKTDWTLVALTSPLLLLNFDCVAVGIAY